MDPKLEDLILQRRKSQENEFKILHKNSHILQKELNEDSDIFKLIQKQKKLDRMRSISQQSSIYEFNHWRYYIYKNLDLFSAMFFDIGCVAITYPLNTTKTRIQCRHPVEDVAFFVNNKVAKTSLYRGVSYGILSQQIFIFSSLTYLKEIEFLLMQYNFKKQQAQTLSIVIADTIGTIFKTPFDVRKQLLQVYYLFKLLKKINDKNITLQKTLSAMRLTLIPSIIRDFLFRSLYSEIFSQISYSRSFFFTQQKYHKKMDEMINTKQTLGSKMNNIFISTFIALLITNPFDVVVTKLATQQYRKYSGFYNCIKTVYREETALKLWFGGMWARFGYYAVTSALVFDFQYEVKKTMSDAFSL